MIATLRPMSEAPKEPLDESGYGPPVLLWVSLVAHPSVWAWNDAMEMWENSLWGIRSASAFIGWLEIPPVKLP